MTTNQYSPLFRLATKSLKFFLWLLFGFAIAYSLSSGLGILQILPMFLYILKHWVLPLGIILLCLIASAVMIESWR